MPHEYVEIAAWLANRDRDRESDRQRYPDINFNRWLDESITENGEFSVWHQIEDIVAAWAAWQSRPLYGSLQDSSALRAAVRKVLQHHGLTKHGDGVVEADLIAAMFKQSSEQAEIDLGLIRQWFDVVQDCNSAYLVLDDYELAERIYESVGMRVPSSITNKITSLKQELAK
jgi:hypothetical protein